MCVSVCVCLCMLECVSLCVLAYVSDCAEDLVSALSTNHSLTELNLNDNNLGDCGVKRLCEVICCWYFYS
uniref:Uncharacterized protein n=1 Tax=Callorhinchus milii TaxID=7868 RepID=A0A4W3GGH6_CALMI